MFAAAWVHRSVGKLGRFIDFTAWAMIYISGNRKYRCSICNQVIEKHGDWPWVDQRESSKYLSRRGKENRIKVIKRTRCKPGVVYLLRNNWRGKVATLLHWVWRVSFSDTNKDDRAVDLNGRELEENRVVSESIGSPRVSHFVCKWRGM